MNTFLHGQKDCCLNWYGERSRNLSPPQENFKLLQLHLLCKGYIFPEVLKHLSKQSKLPHNILILMVCLYD